MYHHVDSALRWAVEWGLSHKAAAEEKDERKCIQNLTRPLGGQLSTLPLGQTSSLLTFTQPNLRTKNCSAFGIILLVYPVKEKNA